MRYTLFTFFFLSLISYIIFPHAVQAQFNQLLQTEINVDMVPENPGPNQAVSVSTVSYSTDINTAIITWTINGKIIKTGRGEKTFNFVTGNMNTTTTLGIKVETGDGEIIEKTIKIKPASVDLLWQTDSFTPPFYKGKPLFSYQNKITFIALPHITGANGVEIPAKNLIYKWKLNGSVVDYVSGYAKNTYTLVGSLIARPLNVSVEVTSPDGEGVGLANTLVTPVNPKAVLYKKSPLYGIEFQKALEGGVSLSDSKEIAVIGMPFFFGTLVSNAPGLSYKWSINGSPINDDGHQTVQVFRQKEGTSGSSNISLSIENSDKILQSANTGFNLKFGQ